MAVMPLAGGHCHSRGAVLGLLMALELLPRDIAGVMVANQGRPLRHRLGVAVCPRRATRHDACPRLPAPEGVGPGIERTARTMDRTIR
jgi:hypothetical protein